MNYSDFNDYELIEYANENNEDANNISDEYDNLSYNQFLAQYGPQKEGNERCFACYEKRMEEVYKYADEIGVDYFATVMTISRQKNSQKLNEIGLMLEKKHKAKYLVSDFKKKKGIDRKIELVKEFGMYNQEYCGCIYSYKEYLDNPDLVLPQKNSSLIIQ